MSQTQQRYDQGAFLLVSGLIEGCEFGVDGSLWSVKKCSGVKMLPSGLHMFIYSSPHSAGISSRHAQFRLLQPKEICVREWTPNGLKSSTSTSSKRRRTAKANANALSTVVSPEYLQTADPELAPYPYDALDAWKGLTKYIDQACLARVIGFDENGDALVDSQMASTADELQISTTRQWGKKREAEAAPVEELAEEMLRFVAFDIKRSWPLRATGEELTLHARDKSWLLEQVLSTQLNSSREQLLAEMQLSFLLFAQLHNFSALEAYKRILSLVVNARDFFLPSNPDCLHFASQVIKDVLTPQFSFLRDEFFTLDLPELDSYFADELGHFRASLSASGASWRASESPNAGAEWKAFVANVWQPMANLVAQKFGWRLHSLNEYAQHKGTKTHYNLLQEGDDLLAEEGEDAPVVVNLDEDYGVIE